MTQSKHTPETVAVAVVADFYARWDGEDDSRAIQGGSQCFHHRDVEEEVFDNFSDELSGDQLEQAVNIAYKLLSGPEKNARATIAKAKGEKVS